MNSLADQLPSHSLSCYNEMDCISISIVNIIFLKKNHAIGACKMYANHRSFFLSICRIDFFFFKEGLTNLFPNSLRKQMTVKSA